MEIDIDSHRFGSLSLSLLIEPLRQEICKVTEKCSIFIPSNSLIFGHYSLLRLYGKG